MCLNGLKIITKAKEKENDMETAKFLKEATRMCKTYRSCDCCPANDGYCITRRQKDKDDFAKYVEIVEKWSRENPAKTRLNEFLDMFPNAAITDGIVDICPAKLDDTIECDNSRDGGCYDCKRKYWLTKVE